tara:strand:+ start:120 stop:1082 length:963 start_codon:yes stop_codon:yes gene_type:complete
LNFSNKKIWVLTDGSDGMISQVMGLAQQFSDNIIHIKTNIFFPWSKLQPGYLPIFSWIFKNKIDVLNLPDLIISCGRKSVYLSIFLKKNYKKIINIHIQDPKINYTNFNFIIAPDHDKVKGKNIIHSIGALHKFNQNTFNEVNDDDFNIPKKNLISVIIGGNNNHYEFTSKEIIDLANKIKNLKISYPNFNFLILYSRRTTEEMKSEIKKILGDHTYIWNEKQKNPYIFALKYSEFFIVTSDSTSMISECAYTKKPIYIFHLPFKRNSKRIKKFHQQFKNLNITKILENKNELIPWKYNSINESKRIASILKQRIIKENL